MENTTNTTNNDFIKFVHQIWFDFGDNANMPDEDTYNTLKHSLAINNPNYMYKLWSLSEATELINEHYPLFSQFFNQNVKYNIVKCDFFRYLLMYHFGGIYIDLDFVSLKPFDDLFNDLTSNKLDLVLPGSSNKSHDIILTEEWYDSTHVSKTLHNGCLISKSNMNPFWLKLLFDIVNSTQIITEKNDIFAYSGTKKLHNHVFSLKHMLNNSITILPYYYICPYMCTSKSNIQNIDHIEFAKDKNDIPTIHTHDWILFSIEQFKNGNVDKICKESYMACIHIPTGSSWR